MGPSKSPLPQSQSDFLHVRCVTSARVGTSGVKAGIEIVAQNIRFPGSRYANATSSPWRRSTATGCGARHAAATAFSQGEAAPRGCYRPQEASALRRADDCKAANISRSARRRGAKLGIASHLHRGRKSQFAASGSSRWPNIVAKRLTCSSAPPPPKGTFRGTADNRPTGRPKSGIDARCHSPASHDGQHPVSRCRTVGDFGRQQVAAFDCWAPLPASLTAVARTSRPTGHRSGLSDADDPVHLRDGEGRRRDIGTGGAGAAQRCRLARLWRSSPHRRHLIPARREPR